MSDPINVHNGGEAPPAANSVANASVVGAKQGALMQLNGGQAPGPGAGSQPPAAATAQPQANTGGDVVGAPPQGGGVHGQ
jgi:hypothetical protein